MGDVNRVKVDWDYADSLYELLRSQFKDKKIIKSLFYTLAEENEKVRIAAVQLAEIKLINNAYGTHLDEIGKLLGVSRKLNDDESYRQLLKIKSYRVRSNSTRDDIVDILARATGTTFDSVYIYPSDSLNITVSVLNPCSNGSTIVREVIDLFPLGANVSIIERTQQTAFGTVSVHATTPSNFVGGFSSVHSSDTNEAPMASLLVQFK